MSDWESEEFIVICEMVGCEAEGIPISVNASLEEPIVWCGTCSTRIINLERCD